MLHGAASETKKKSLRSPSESSSQLQEATMEHSLEAWPWGQDANSMSSPLSLYTSSWIRRTAGTYTHPHTWANKHQWVLTDDSTQILQAPTQATFLFMSWAALTNVHSSKKLGRNVRGASSPTFMLKKVVKNSSNWMINDCVCSPSSPFSRPLFPPPPLPSLSPSFHLQSTANIYLVVYPGSMQSWMSATHEFFCSESMVSRMYSPPFSTCGSSQKLQSYTELCSVHHVKARKENPTKKQVKWNLTSAKSWCTWFAYQTFFKFCFICRVFQCYWC